MKKLPKPFLPVLLCLIFAASTSHAQWVVFDPSNFAKNAITMLETIKQRIMQAQQLRIEVETQLKNFAKLEFSIGDDLASNLRELFASVGTVQGLMQDLQGLDQRFGELYPNLEEEDSKSLEELRTMSDEWLDESREMMRGAAHVGAQILENIPQSQSQIDQVLSDSQAALGVLQVSQAGNQLMAKIGESLAQLNAQLATYHQAHMSFLLKETEEESAQKNWERHYFEKKNQGSTTFRLSGNNYTGGR